ncbi:hypothetical protein N665_2299s0001 [Sinapis alba]|nr:hypothetical protein N665_2299s0001 [Sinapis alba]
MECRKSYFFVAVLVILFAVSSSKNVCNPACKGKQPFNCDNPLTFNRTSFPKNFTFGAATSAYQIEGAAHRALNGWDYFTHRYPERVPDHSSGDLACDSYDLYKEDVKLLKRMKAQAYRLSIAWSRILPSIEPYVTIFHWDVPQTLEDEYGGFLSRRIVEDYKNYAELLFQRFGDRVKFWITLNQPYSLASKGYGDGSYPPGRCTGCEFGGNSGTEPYIVAHNQLLAHAKTVALYRKRYQKLHGGKIGTTLIGRWFTPLNENSILDKAAAKRAFDFIVGWFLDPLIYGRYPKIMRQMVGRRLPKFTPQESKLVKGSLDFLGLNYYVTQYATNAPPSTQPSVLTDSRVRLDYYRNGVPIGVQVTINFDLYSSFSEEITTFI